MKWLFTLLAVGIMGCSEKHNPDLETVRAALESITKSIPCAPNEPSPMGYDYTPMFHAVPAESAFYTYGKPTPIAKSQPISVASLESVETRGGEIIFLYKRAHWDRSDFYHAPMITDSIWKDIYAYKGGAIQLDRHVIAKLIPPKSIPERIEWPE